MNRLSSWIALAILTAGAAGGLAWRATRERARWDKISTAERMRQTEFRMMIARDEARTTQARADAERARKVIASLSAVPAALPAAATKSADTTPVATVVPKTLSDFLRALPEVERPEVQVRFFASQRAALTPRYAPLFRTLATDGPRQEAFKDNIMRRTERLSDLHAAAQTQGFSLGDPAIVKLRGDVYSEYEVAQRTLLGEDGYRALIEFERTSDLRGLIGNIAGMATLAGVPLTRGQIDQLLRTAAAASETYRNGGNATTTGVDWNAVLTQGARFLTDEQMKLIRSTEAPGSGIFHAQWNAALVRATAEERKGPLFTPVPPAPAKKPGSRG